MAMRFELFAPVVLFYLNCKCFSEKSISFKRFRCSNLNLKRFSDSFNSSILLVECDRSSIVRILPRRFSDRLICSSSGIL